MMMDPSTLFEEAMSDETAAVDAILEKRGRKKLTVDEWLNSVNYKEMNTGHYVPSVFALHFTNFIKLVNGVEGEQNKTPVVHLRMLDQIAGEGERIANLCARGLAKTTLMFEYLALYIAVFGEIPGFGKVPGMIYVSDSMDNGVASARQNIEFRYHNSDFLKEYLPEAKFTDKYIRFRNKDGKFFGIKLFGAKTGLRGSKINGRRPVLAVLDDLVSDDDAKSKVAMQAIKDTVYKGINYALDPNRRKIVFNGTPFNKDDVLYEAVESGAWVVNVYPVCERFPCSREEFNGAWEDRFTYDYVQEEYESALLAGKLDAFMQELMLRITNEEDRLVQDGDIRWYARSALLRNRSSFNFYITTDFATTAKQSGDFSVISVWAINSLGDWFLVDGVCAKQDMSKNINDLFRLAQMYSPLGVGIEVSGQQGAFITWIQNEMMSRNQWFTITTSGANNTTQGIRPVGDKMSRFQQALPLFKSGKIYFPSELKATPFLGEFMEELTLASKDGFKSKHDDAIDTISMLVYMKAWKPSEASSFELDEEDASESTGSYVWVEDDDEGFTDTNPINSYLVS